MRAALKRHPKLRFFLLTNFPNWGYKGDVSYHGTGPNRQQLGDYDEVVNIVLRKVNAAGLNFAGITVDNPYEYLIGEHKSSTLKDPSNINWLKRVRMYEKFCDVRRLPFNLIINSETGGGTSDKEFYKRTLKMLETYINSGGNPSRYIVQSWYPFPEKTVPENKPYTMTYLVKAVLKKLEEPRQKMYTNPVIEEIGPADPTVIFFDGKYYLYPTGDSQNYYVYTSTDLVNWKKGNIVFHHKDGGLWAPDIYVCKEDGKFYLYYTSKMRVGVAVADSPLGPFQDKGILVNDAIDGHLFRDDDGKLYLYYVKQPGFRITVQKMKSPLKKSSTKPKLIIRPTEPWEKIQGDVTEGPWMLKHKNKYYLLYSGTGASTLNYAIGYATAKKPTGPFKKYSGNPIVKRGNGVLGPGHGCVVKDSSNNLWSVYHQQKDGSRDWNRFVCIDPLWFDNKGILHGKVTRGTPQPAPSVAKKTTGDYMEKQQSLTKEISDTIKVKYLLYLPEDYQKSKNDWPLILFLHGAGERGDQLKKVEWLGPPMLIAKKGKHFPFVIVSPQCPENDWWSSESQINVLNVLLDDIVSQYRIDKDRIYVTGLSMGGYGTWKLALDYPNRFAAIAPICGQGSPEDAGKIKHLPVWVFHGAKDEVVPLKHSEEMVDALKKIGGNVKFTVYPDAGHDSWTDTYNNSELFDWFLKHRRSENK